MNRRGLMALATALALLTVFAASAVPAFSADNGAVNAQVKAEAAVACITLSPSTVDFGTQALNAPGAGVAQGGSSAITLTKCGSDVDVSVRGSDATGPGREWALTDGAVCDASGTPNRYKLGLGGVPGEPRLFLTTTDVLAFHLTPAFPSVTQATHIVMPCTGSDGAGQTMTMSYTFTAVVA